VALIAYEVRHLLSRHMVVCHLAQEAGLPHPCVINRKNKNAIFTAYIAPWYFNETKQFLQWKCRPMSSPHISNKLHWAFPRYEPSKIGLVSLFSFFFLCFLFFLLFVKVWKLLWNTNALSNCLEIWYPERRDKGTSWC